MVQTILANSGSAPAAPQQPQEHGFTAPDGTFYHWDKPTPPTQNDLDAIVAYHQARIGRIASKGASTPTPDRQPAQIEQPQGALSRIAATVPHTNLRPSPDRQPQNQPPAFDYASEVAKVAHVDPTTGETRVSPQDQARLKDAFRKDWINRYGYDPDKFPARYAQDKVTDITQGVQDFLHPVVGPISVAAGALQAGLNPTRSLIQMGQGHNPIQENAASAESMVAGLAALPADIGGDMQVLVHPNSGIRDRAGAIANIVLKTVGPEEILAKGAGPIVRAVKVLRAGGAQSAAIADAIDQALKSGIDQSALNSSIRDRAQAGLTAKGVRPIPEVQPSGIKITPEVPTTGVMTSLAGDKPPIPERPATRTAIDVTQETADRKALPRNAGSNGSGGVPTIQPLSEFDRFVQENWRTRTQGLVNDLQALIDNQAGGGRRYGPLKRELQASLDSGEVHPAVRAELQDIFDKQNPQEGATTNESIGKTKSKTRKRSTVQSGGSIGGEIGGQEPSGSSSGGGNEEVRQSQNGVNGPSGQEVQGQTIAQGSDVGPEGRQVQAQNEASGQGEVNATQERNVTQNPVLEHQGADGHLQELGQDRNVNPEVQGGGAQAIDSDQLSGQGRKRLYEVEGPQKTAERATGLANQVQEREALNGVIADVEKTKGKAPEDWQSVGRQSVEDGKLDPYQIAHNIGAGREELTGEKVGALLEGKRRLMNALEAAGKALDASPGDPHLKAAYDHARDTLDKYLGDIQKGKGRWSDVGRALQAGTHLDTANPEAVLLAARRGAGGELSAKAEARIRDVVQKHNEAQATIEDLQRQLREERLKRTAEPEAPGTTRQARKAKIQEERQQIFDEIGKLLQSGVHSNPIPQVTKLGIQTGKLALNLVKEGALTLEEAIAKAIEHVKSRGGDVSREDVILGIDNEIKSKTVTRDEVAQRLATARRAAQKAAREIRGEEPAYREGASVKTKTATNLERLNKQIAEYERRLREKDYAPAPSANERALAKQEQEAIARRDRLKAQVHIEIAKNQKLTPYDMLLRLQRLNILSGPTVFGKLAVASASHSLITPIEDLIGRAVAKNSVEGIASAKANAAAVKEFFTKETRQDALSKAKGKGGSLDVLGKPKDFRHPVWGFFENLHAAVKTPLQRAEFKRSAIKMTEFLEKQGVDTSTPEALASITTHAYAKSLEAVLLNDSKLSSWLSESLNSLGRRSPGARFAAESLMPIRKVPINFVGRTAEYTGLPAFVNILKSPWAKELSVAEKDAIYRSYKRGGIGAGMMVLGALNPHATDNLPSWVEHTPLIAILKLGGALRQGWDDSQGYNKKSGGVDALTSMGYAAAKAGADFVQNLPTQNVATIAAAAGRSADTNDVDKLGKGMADYVTSFVIPQVVQQGAKLADNERVSSGANYYKARGFREQVMAKVPGLRQELPDVPVPNRAEWFTTAQDTNLERLQQYGVSAKPPVWQKNPDKANFDSNADQYNERIKAQGDAIKHRLDMIKAQGFFPGAKDDQARAKLLTEAIKEARQQANAKVNGSRKKAA